ncbi:MmcQ/YjbR family DNA-binding protein [Clostridium arbusti]|uniref:MmcQ/YjbR family DNA-binding protein n=1 Tax=Clostridium arbusti TaxID=1137848 RepID=UPI00028A2D22|nr:MmcQ/YjbR family DNA-binding protein [Clostridium arbusti]
MYIYTLKKYCLSQKCSQEDYPFGSDVIVIKVCSKMFALISNRDNKINISLKCDPFLADSLRQDYKYIIPGYHLNKKHWNTIIVDDSVSKEQIYCLIDHSYKLVFKSLSKKQQEQILLK